MTRSNKQNKYYWGVVIQKALEYYEEKPADLLRDLVSATDAEITSKFAHELFKMMFNFKGSTTKLNTKEMMEYQDSIRELFFHRGFDIPPPNQPPIKELS